MPDQKNLFGEIDAVYNTLETELTIVGEEISKNQKSIDRAEDKIMKLEERRTEIKNAVAIVKAQRDELEPEEEEQVLGEESDFIPEEEDEGMGETLESPEEEEL